MSQRNAVYTGVVVTSRDPRRLGRVKVSLPAFDEERWARRASPAAGDRTGAWLVPDPGDEVLVAFEGGDARRPIVVGALWNRTERPPESNPERTVVKTKHGATVVLDDGTGAVEISDANGNELRLGPGGITITAALRVAISAPEIEVNAAVSTFTGVVQCDTLVANSVVSASYTPGAGNLL